MKKIYLIGSLLILGSGVSQNIDAKTNLPEKFSAEKHKNTKVTKNPVRISSSTEVIYEVEGTQKLYKSVASGFYESWGGIESYQNFESPCDVVLGDKGEIYVKNLVPFVGNDTFVKGILQDGVVRFELPQTLAFYDDYEYGIDMVWLSEEDGTYVYDEEVSYIDFLYTEDGTMTMEEENEGILGVIFSDDFSWTNVGATNIRLEPFTQEEVVMPETAEIQQYAFVEDSYGYMVEVGRDGNDFYFRGLFADYPMGTFMGTLNEETGIVTVEANQYMGMESLYFIYLSIADVPTANPDEGYELFPKYEFYYDEEKDIFTPVNPDLYLIANTTTDDLFYYDVTLNPVLKYQKDFAGVPANPYDLDFYDFLNEYGFSWLIFTVPMISTEGNLLDTDNLYYRLYVDGEVFEFEESIYETDGDVTLIPFDFTGYYIFKYGFNSFEVDLLIEGMSTLGIQSVYIYDGEETESEIVEIQLDSQSGVETVSKEMPVAVEYYDLNGRKVNNPSNGLYIVKEYGRNGSVTTKKVIKR